MPTEILKTCPICRRIDRMTWHHLIPKGARKYLPNATIKLGRKMHVCRSCHDGIHILFSNWELAMLLSTESKLVVLAKYIVEASSARSYQYRKLNSLREEVFKTVDVPIPGKEIDA